MLEHFARPDGLSAQGGCDDVKRLLGILQHFPACRVLTLPAGPVQVDWAAEWASHPEAWREVRARLLARIASYVELAASAGIRLALEIMPFSLIGGIRRFLNICEELRSPWLGLNFDTGHAWACRELVPALPFELAGRIFGTHLGDNLSAENVKRPPGQGSIAWKPLLANLRAAGYEGSLDLEIGCPADRVDEEYRAGLAYLESLGISRNGDRT
jgi:sugar phosphate isomerase/epimerase